MGLKVSGVAPDLTKNIEFEELLTSTFPGFFSAITLFMLIDILSPKEITSWVFNDISSLIGFIGFVLLFGTILGVIIDGIHHEIIERFIFKKFLEMKKIDEISKALYPLKEASMYSYFHNMMGEKYIDTLSFFIKSQYRYSEFYANTFISLLPLSIIAPFYLFNTFQVSWTLSIIIGIITLIISSSCLRNSYMSLLNYKNIYFSYICGYLNNYIDITNVSTVESSICCKFNKNEKVEIEAQILDIECNNQQKGEIVFKTNFGNFSDSDNGENKEFKSEINGENKAKACLSSTKSGIAIVTASSFHCVPGEVCIEFQ